MDFRIWAPAAKIARLFLEAGPGSPSDMALTNEGDGYFSGIHSAAAAGSLYRFQLGDEQNRPPDPASRFQPDGPHGASAVIDPLAFAWTDSEWAGVKIEGQVFYEMHIGTFTKEGTWNAAREQLKELPSVGITVLEVMPIADFPGRFGWGYDGVNFFAPTWLYGQPDDLRQFVDEAHAQKLAVVLDVVYNHVGPDGNVLKSFSPAYFTPRYETDWGEAINFDGDDSAPVREYFITNASYWIDEFHLDGLRLDATQDIHDRSSNHILSEVTDAARKAAGRRSVVLIAENEPQHTKLVRSRQQGGYGLDALWNDDFHHSALVALTGRNEAYYSDYGGTPQEFISTIKYGYLSRAVVPMAEAAARHECS